MKAVALLSKKRRRICEWVIFFFFWEEYIEKRDKPNLVSGQQRKKGEFFAWFQWRSVGIMVFVSSQSTTLFENGASKINGWVGQQNERQNKGKFIYCFLSIIVRGVLLFSLNSIIFENGAPKRGWKREREKIRVSGEERERQRKQIIYRLPYNRVKPVDTASTVFALLKYYTFSVLCLPEVCLITAQIQTRNAY